ncbi:MAG: L-aspartate oxidase [Akkermansiaceae bacterium]|nr:L-aspartate oxidase [Akkermansiaceae bacterium]MCP5550723.1 L-aspartate oxidase [Akkermansiaceae bacterium]
MKTHDFIVVGSGIAGLSFALRAAKHGSVAIVTKKGAADTNTAQAQGGIACVRSEEDSFDRHVADTLDAGAGLCPEDVVRTIVSEGPRAIDELIAWGVDFDSRETGDGETELDLGREGGHTKRRILHSKDTTGREIETKLLAALRETENVTLLERHFAIDLITTARLGFATPPRCVGIYVLNEDSGEVETLRSDRVVLCTGGCGRVYIYTTNPSVATGDGVAMAWRAGVEVANMEFVQFHPTCLYHREVKSFLITEAMRGEGAILVDQDRRDFVKEYDPRGSLAPRDIVARAIDRELKRTGRPCVYLDITHKPKDFIAERFPHIYETCLDLGIDAATEPIPVVPAAHYQCGGVRTDVNGATSLAGLWAVGEVACTGLHGANRLASNSLLEGAVVSDRALRDALAKRPPSKPAETLKLPEWISGNVTDVDELVVIYHNWDEIRRLMWDYVSIVRTSKRLQRAATRLQNLQREVQEFYWNFRVTPELLELRNLVEVASLIVDSAARRRESRGLHYTLDYPETDDKNWRKDTILRRF